MGTATGNVTDPFGLESLDQTGSVTAQAGAVAQLTVVTLAPREDPAIHRQSHRVFAPCSELSELKRSFSPSILVTICHGLFYFYMLHLIGF